MPRVSRHDVSAERPDRCASGVLVCPGTVWQGAGHTGDHKTAGSLSCNFSWNAEGPFASSNIISLGSH
jgi:hypothetical protein